MPLSHSQKNYIREKFNSYVNSSSLVTSAAGLQAFLNVCFGTHMTIGKLEREIRRAGLRHNEVIPVDLVFSLLESRIEGGNEGAEPIPSTEESEGAEFEELDDGDSVVADAPRSTNFAWYVRGTSGAAAAAMLQNDTAFATGNPLFEEIEIRTPRVTEIPAPHIVIGSGGGDQSLSNSLPISASMRRLSRLATAQSSPLQQHNSSKQLSSGTPPPPFSMSPLLNSIHSNSINVANKEALLKGSFSGSMRLAAAMASGTGSAAAAGGGDADGFMGSSIRSGQPAAAKRNSHLQANDVSHHYGRSRIKDDLVNVVEEHAMRLEWLQGPVSVLLKAKPKARPSVIDSQGRMVKSHANANGSLSSAGISHSRSGVQGMPPSSYFNPPSLVLREERKMERLVMELTEEDPVWAEDMRRQLEALTAGSRYHNSTANTTHHHHHHRNGTTVTTPPTHQPKADRLLFNNSRPMSAMGLRSEPSAAAPRINRPHSAGVSRPSVVQNTAQAELRTNYAENKFVSRIAQKRRDTEARIEAAERHTMKAMRGGFGGGSSSRPSSAATLRPSVDRGGGGGGAGVPINVSYSNVPAVAALHQHKLDQAQKAARFGRPSSAPSSRAKRASVDGSNTTQVHNVPASNRPRYIAEGTVMFLASPIHGRTTLKKVGGVAGQASQYANLQELEAAIYASAPSTPMGHTITGIFLLVDGANHVPLTQDTFGLVPTMCTFGIATEIASTSAAAVVAARR